MHDEIFPPGSIGAQVIEILKTCYDPEIPVNIYDLGLIYDVQVTDDEVVEVTMTLTSPACPVAGSLPPEVQERIRTEVKGIAGVKVQVVWDPPWSIDRMSEAAKIQLGIM